MTTAPANRLKAPDKALLAAYGGAWRLALPALAASARLREGWAARRAPRDWAAPCDVWVQAASGGEAYLAWELFKAAAAATAPHAGNGAPSPNVPGGAQAPADGAAAPRKITFLATSCTSQGLSVLEKAASWCRDNAPHVAVRTAFFPFDAPGWMRRALDQAAPRAVVLLETEIWPGLLAACAEKSVPALVLNGRMNARSLAGYLALRPFLRRVAPARVLAISEADAARFDLLFGAATAEPMPNMKFDRFASAPEIPFDANPVAKVVEPGASFVVFGSVREEEESDVRAALKALLAERPKTVIGLFPRHMHRVAAWKGHLKADGLHAVPRSRAGGPRGPVEPGTVVLWDSFGELGAAYGLARAAFVGGSLKPLGGQNFLEPLAQGVEPFIGPYWSNFAWVGREIVESGLVREVRSADELAAELAKTLKRPTPPAKVKARAAAYMDAHRGGAARAWAALARLLDGEAA
jgi:3-deoxy-D-manno-octulosonic-acid transferase